MRIVSALLLACSQALAGSIHSEWSRPTTRENGQEFKAEEIRAYELWHQCGNKMPVTWVTPETSITINNLYGVCQFKVRVEDTSGQFSAYSNVVTKTLKLKRPARGGFR